MAECVVLGEVWADQPYVAFRLCVPFLCRIHIGTWQIWRGHWPWESSISSLFWQLLSPLHYGQTGACGVLSIMITSACEEVMLGVLIRKIPRPRRLFLQLLILLFRPEMDWALEIPLSLHGCGGFSGLLWSRRFRILVILRVREDLRWVDCGCLVRLLPVVWSALL